MSGKRRQGGSVGARDRNTLGRLKAQQMAWAERNGIRLDRPGYTATVEANLVRGALRLETRQEFELGDGGELRDQRSRPAKMRALASSSALAVNFFDPWRDVDMSALAEALQLPQECRGLQFEYRCEGYPFPRRPPNLDLRLTLNGGRHIAIESKFTEPYSGKTASSDLSSSYFRHPRGLWNASGLQRAQCLADSLAPRWISLDVAQLLKHMLGLAGDPTLVRPELIYLWYDAGTAESLRHRRELERFAREVEGDSVPFRYASYQEVFGQLESRVPKPFRSWAGYMSQRYFSDTDLVMRKGRSATLGALFRERPEGWGLRGDPFLWDEMEEELIDAPVPHDLRDCRMVLERTFERLVGQPLVLGDEQAFVRRYNHGGMSGGWVSMEFWHQTAFPEILRRWGNAFGRG